MSELQSRSFEFTGSDTTALGPIPLTLEAE